MLKTLQIQDVHGCSTMGCRWLSTLGVDSAGCCGSVSLDWTFHNPQPKGEKERGNDATMGKSLRNPNPQLRRLHRPLLHTFTLLVNKLSWFLPSSQVCMKYCSLQGQPEISACARRDAREPRPFEPLGLRETGALRPTGTLHRGDGTSGVEPSKIEPLYIQACQLPGSHKTIPSQFPEPVSLGKNLM